MLRDRNTPAFPLGSLQLHGGVGDELYQVADEILNGPLHPVHVTTRRAATSMQKCLLVTPGRSLNTTVLDFAGFAATVEVTGKVAGIMVSRGKLLINKNLKTPSTRIDALLQHEVGTHLLTYYNGRAQPFRQLYSGLAGYDELQEGLAVLTEYLVNGLGRPRMRQLAAHVWLQLNGWSRERRSLTPFGCSIATMTSRSVRLSRPRCASTGAVV